jgi:hypothetical protein
MLETVESELYLQVVPILDLSWLFKYYALLVPAAGMEEFHNDFPWGRCRITIIIKHLAQLLSVNPLSVERFVERIVRPAGEHSLLLCEEVGVERRVRRKGRPHPHSRRISRHFPMHAKLNQLQSAQCMLNDFAIITKMSPSLTK